MTRFRQILAKISLVILSPAILAALIIGLAFMPLVALALWIEGRWLRWAFCRKWGREGKDLLLVYSNSPHWQEYVEREWLPRLQDRAVVLNWSQRSAWSRTARLEGRVFTHYAGDKEFNPVAIHLPPRGVVTVIRFWDAFRDLKHGPDAVLKVRERQLFDLLGAGSGAAA